MEIGINITKKDVAWSYISKFFQIATGFITLPLVLHFLTAEEIGMNYLMLTISSIVALLDFGFGPQFGRNFTYVNSGAQSILREGVCKDVNGTINYHLLSVLLKTAKFVYARLSLIALFVMFSFGSIYIYSVTKGFSNVNGALPIWLLFSVSTFFNIYYSYYNSLLIGSGMIRQSAIATILSKSSYIIICIILLLLHFGLISVVVSNLISPFVQRYYSYKVYYTPELKSKLDDKIEKSELKDTFNTIWYNAKKLGVNFIGGYAINKSGMFLIGLFLPLKTVASYGLLVQLVTILFGVSQTMFTAYEPKFAYYRVKGKRIELIKLMSFSISVYWLFMLSGFIIIIFIVPYLLEFINAKTYLPSFSVVILYMIAMLLEGNHSDFATLIVTDNKIPFVKAGIISGMGIVFLSLISLSFTSLGLLGIVLSQFFVQLAYNNWKWPIWVFEDLNISFKDFCKYGIETFNEKIMSLINRL